MKSFIKIYLSIILSFFIYSCNEINTKSEKNLSLVGSEHENQTENNPKHHLTNALTRLENLRCSIYYTSVESSIYQVNTFKYLDLLIRDITNLIEGNSIEESQYQNLTERLDYFIKNQTLDKFAYNFDFFKTLKARITYLNAVLTNYTDRNDQRPIDPDFFVKLNHAKKSQITQEQLKEYPLAPAIIIYRDIFEIFDLIQRKKLEEAADKNPFKEINQHWPRVVFNMHLALLRKAKIDLANALKNARIQKWIKHTNEEITLIREEIKILDKELTQLKTNNEKAKVILSRIKELKDQISGIK